MKINFYFISTLALFFSSVLLHAQNENYTEITAIDNIKLKLTTMLLPPLVLKVHLYKKNTCGC